VIFFEITKHGTFRPRRTSYVFKLNKLQEAELYGIFTTSHRESLCHYKNDFSFTLHKTRNLQRGRKCSNGTEIDSTYCTVDSAPRGPHPFVVICLVCFITFYRSVKE